MQKGKAFVRSRGRKPTFYSFRQRYVQNTLGILGRAWLDLAVEKQQAWGNLAQSIMYPDRNGVAQRLGRRELFIKCNFILALAREPLIEDAPIAQKSPPPALFRSEFEVGGPATSFFEWNESDPDRISLIRGYRSFALTARRAASRFQLVAFVFGSPADDDITTTFTEALGYPQAGEFVQTSIETQLPGRLPSASWRSSWFVGQ